MKSPRHAMMHIVESTPHIGRIKTRQFWGSLAVAVGGLALIAGVFVVLS